MEINYQGKTYRFGDTDTTNYFTELREMVASDMWRPLFQDKPIPYHKVSDVDIEDFMNKYFIRESNREDFVNLFVGELRRRAKVFEPMKSIDEDAYNFALISLAENFCQYRLSFFIALNYFDTFNEWFDEQGFTFIRLEERKTDEPIYFRCDFSKAEFDVDSYFKDSSDELECDIFDAFNVDDLAQEIESIFLKEFGLV